MTSVHAGETPRVAVFKSSIALVMTEGAKRQTPQP